MLNSYLNHMPIYAYLRNYAPFLSPARRGRGILVAPGLCPASGDRRPASRFLVGGKTQELLVKSF